jgi:hypothetical protein
MCHVDGKSEVVKARPSEIAESSENHHVVLSAPAIHNPKPEDQTRMDTTPERGKSRLRWLFWDDRRKTGRAAGKMAKSGKVPAEQFRPDTP